MLAKRKHDMSNVQREQCIVASSIEGDIHELSFAARDCIDAKQPRRRIDAAIPGGNQMCMAPLEQETVDMRGETLQQTRRVLEIEMLVFVSHG